MNRLVYTNANFQPQPFLAEWAISARKLANYTGEMLVLDYGLEAWFRKLLHSYDVRTIECGLSYTSFPIWNSDKNRPIAMFAQRFIDIIPIIERDYPQHSIAFFDADIWFQKPIDNVFDLAAQSKGVVYAPDVSWCRQRFFSSKEELRCEYDKKAELIIESYGSTIQGGFHCAKADVLLSKLATFRQLVKDGTFQRDQVVTNWLYDFDKDNTNGYLYDCIGTDTHFNNDDKSWRLNRTNETCIGLHLAGPYHDEPHRQFRNNFPDLFRDELGKRNIDPFKIAPYRKIFS